MYVPGESLEIRARLEVKEPVDDPVFGVIIYDDAGRYLWGTNTALRDVSVGTLSLGRDGAVAHPGPSRPRHDLLGHARRHPEKRAGLPLAGEGLGFQSREPRGRSGIRAFRCVARGGTGIDAGDRLKCSRTRPRASSTRTGACSSSTRPTRCSSAPTTTRSTRRSSLMGSARPGDVAVDVGAMIGYYTVILAQDRRRRRACLRVRARSAELRAADRERRDERLRARDAATGRRRATSGTTQLFRAPEQIPRRQPRVRRPKAASRSTVDMVALDDAIDGPVDLVKIDVQGYEVHVLAGMRDLSHGRRS